MLQSFLRLHMSPELLDKHYWKQCIGFQAVLTFIGTVNKAMLHPEKCCQLSVAVWTSIFIMITAVADW